MDDEEYYPSTPAEVHPLKIIIILNYELIELFHLDQQTLLMMFLCVRPFFLAALLFVLFFINFHFSYTKYCLGESILIKYEGGLCGFIQSAMPRRAMTAMDVTGNETDEERQLSPHSFCLFVNLCQLTLFERSRSNYSVIE